MSARPSRWVVTRDVTSYLGGWALMLKQAGIFFVPPPQPNETLIWVSALLIGVPGVIQVIGWRFGTGGGGSAPAPPALPSSLPPSVTPTGAGDAR